MTASITRRTALGTGLAATALTRRARAERPPIRIGVLTDMAGVYAANTGPGSVVGAQLAVEDFLKTNPGFPEVDLALQCPADLQLKPDVAMAISGQWHRCHRSRSDRRPGKMPLSSAASPIS